MNNDIGNTPVATPEVAQLLTKLLAEECVLYTKTRYAHWNVGGPIFHTVSVFFQSQYQQLEEIFDSVAKKIRTLGHYPIRILKVLLEHTQDRRKKRQLRIYPGIISGR
ncbi:Dps family protein [Mucilaginibacter terrenus]|uniref:Dps family protein n=1 Tax=Mucilaginibacter terrenus TaxID=2482727 RepID=UPI00197B0D42|nr:DNA starvation/stationary phase protection protein [Mucilaginibacter terrenus]